MLLKSFALQQKDLSSSMKLEAGKRNIVLHYKYQGKTFTTDWVHDYFVSKGKYCFAVSDKTGKISGLLPVDMIDKDKSGVSYQEAGKFARDIKAEVKAQQGL